MVGKAVQLPAQQEISTTNSPQQIKKNLDSFAKMKLQIDIYEYFFFKIIISFVSRWLWSTEMKGKPVELFF